MPCARLAGHLAHLVSGSPRRERAALVAYDVSDSESRLQEIVFIGAGMDAGAISEQLDSALLTDEELKRYVANWASCPDPPHAPGAASNGAAAT